MKRWATTCIALIIVLICSFSAFAMEVPTDTVVQNLNGVQQCIKTYTVSPETDPQDLIEEPFEYEGYNYKYASITKVENEFADEMQHTETVTVETKKKDMSVVLEALPVTVDYDDGKYTGTLYLDHTTIETVASGYYDFDLVFCSPNGTPIEGSVINRSLAKHIKKNGLPKVVFHSIRHTSTTYKLKLSGGDIKAVQGDTGHGTAQMVTEQYAHIIDDDRKANAARFQEAFYSTHESQNASPEPNAVQLPSIVSSDDQKLVLKLLSNPKALELLRGLANAI